MSTHDAERMITVAELLRREGVSPDDGTSRAMKAAVATGVAVLCGATVTGMLALAPSLSTSFFPSDPDGSSMRAGAGGSADAASSQGEDRPRPVSNRTEQQQAAGEVVPASVEVPKALARQSAKTPTRIPAMTQIAPDPVRADAQRSSGRTESPRADSRRSPAESTPKESPPESTESKPESSEESSKTNEQSSETTETEEPSAESEQPPAEQDDPEQDESKSEEPTPSESAEQDDEKEHPRGKSAERGRPDNPGQHGRRP